MIYIYMYIIKEENSVNSLAYCDSTYWSLETYIYLYIYCCTRWNCVKTLAYCDGTYWSLVADIYIYIYIAMYNEGELRCLWLIATVRTGR